MGRGKVINRPRPRLLLIEVRWRLGARRPDTPRGSSPAAAAAAAAARSGLRGWKATARGRRAARITGGGGCLSGWSRGEGRSGHRAGGGGAATRDRLRRQRRAPARSAGTGRAGRVALTMVGCWDTGVLLCALLGGLLLTGEARPGPGPGAGAGWPGRGHAPGAGCSRGERARRELGALVAADSPGAVAPSLPRREVGVGASESSWLRSAEHRGTRVPRSSLPRESPNLSTWPPPPSRGSLPGSGLGERGAPGPARPPAPPPRLPGRVRRAPGAGALRTPVRLPEEWPEAWPWRFGALATMSLLPREGGEPLWKASRA